LSRSWKKKPKEAKVGQVKQYSVESWKEE